MHKYCQKMCDLFRYFISYCSGNSKYTVTKGFCRTCTRLSNKPWSYMVVYSFVNGRMHTFVPYSGGNGFPGCLRFTFSNVLSDIECCDRFVLICTALWNSMLVTRGIQTSVKFVGHADAETIYNLLTVSTKLLKSTCTARTANILSTKLRVASLSFCKLEVNRRRKVCDHFLTRQD